MRKRNRIDIPPSARASKPWFFEQPDDEIITEIKEFIEKTGKPYLWRGHTHNKPPPDKPVVYLDEFCLPKACRRDEDLWSPCPCCHDDIPWFMGTDREPAKIAWFPEEGIIRLIGHHCFAALNREGHEQALRDLRRRQEHKKHVQFVAKNIHLLDKALAAIDHNMEIAELLDAFRQCLQRKLAAFTRFRLYDNIRNGQLIVTTRSSKLIWIRTARRKSNAPTFAGFSQPFADTSFSNLNEHP